MHQCKLSTYFDLSKLTFTDFEHSSNRRILAFSISLPTSSISKTEEFVTIDGVGRISHTIRLRAHLATLSTLPLATQRMIRQTEDSRKSQDDQDDDTIQVMILQEDPALGDELEQWATEYTDKFVHAAGPKFYPTTMAHILGTAYVKKKLPEVSSLGFP